MSETALAECSAKDLERWFSSADLVVKRQRELDRRSASNFSVFRFIDADENLLSDIFKFLLDPRETHAQQTLFLNGFMTRLDRPGLPKLDEATVTREAGTFSISNYRRRIDLLIRSQKCVIAVENKIDAKEGGKQLHDYYEHLSRTCRSDYCLVFLTPNGRSPISMTAKLVSELRLRNKLYLLSYCTDIHDWLSECRKNCQADNIRHFIDNLLGYIRTHLQIAAD